MIELKDFKNQIENNNVDKNFLIFKYSGNGDFIVHQYLESYKNKNNLEVENIEDLSAVSNTNLFGDISTTIKFYETETFDIENINTKDILWVKCKKIPKSIEKKYENIINIPKLEEWQIKDYIKSNIPEIGDENIDFMCSMYKDNIYRIDKEIDKIKLFNKNERKSIFNIIKDQLFTDISEYSIFDIVNSIVRKDTDSLVNAYVDIQNIDVEPFGLLALLTNNFKHVIDIQLAKNPSAESVGVSSKQYWAIKNYSCGFYSKDELVEIYKLLTSIDLKIKTGQLDTSNVVDYLVCKIML